MLERQVYGMRDRQPGALEQVCRVRVTARCVGLGGGVPLRPCLGSHPGAATQFGNPEFRVPQPRCAAGWGGAGPLAAPLTNPLRSPLLTKAWAERNAVYA
ncbi:hypothetical protein Pcinc_015579 [Petrolisthes cinctipes]|uniref:Uncharacterized protein n=1 Tax=Petrolisthes cinctipes TaxID=88211 RepID=A0AAE1KQK5_PETCI|nr:hypothetical protein Pcinc_015579 [Petrolisthes cinctipes]